MKGLSVRLHLPGPIRQSLKVNATLKEISIGKVFLVASAQSSPGLWSQQWVQCGPIAGNKSRGEEGLGPQGLKHSKKIWVRFPGCPGFSSRRSNMLAHSLSSFLHSPNLPAHHSTLPLCHNHVQCVRPCATHQGVGVDGQGGQDGVVTDDSQ